MVDISATREAYNQGIISNIGLISSNDNLADGLTKISSNKALLQLMKTQRLSHTVLQFVIARRPRCSDLQKWGVCSFTRDYPLTC